MITNHTQLLNALIEKYGLKSYLEIGVQNPANNFDKINIEDSHKQGVDPDVEGRPDILQHDSDWFFNNYNEGFKFDLIFIDGLHHADQVKRDFENSLRCLSDNGFIVIHDVLPENEEGTKVPRETKMWWGDVYKFAMNMQKYYGLKFKTFDIDNGCMLVWVDGNPILDTLKHDEYTYQNYIDVGHHLMNVTSTVEI